MALSPFGESLPVSFPFFTRPAFTTNATGPRLVCEPPVPNPVLTFIMCRKPAPVFHTCMFAPPVIVVESSTHVSAMQRSSTPPAAVEVTVPGPAIPCTVSRCPATSTVTPDANVAVPVTVTSSDSASEAANTWSPSMVMATDEGAVATQIAAATSAARMLAHHSGSALPNLPFETLCVSSALLPMRRVRTRALPISNNLNDIHSSFGYKPPLRRRPPSPDSTT